MAVAAFPLVILALFILVGLMFYERNRRADLRRQESLQQRMVGGVSAVRNETRHNAEAAPPRPSVLQAPEFLRPLEHWLAQSGLEMSLRQFLMLTVLAGLVGLLLTALWFDIKFAGFCALGFAGLPSVYALIQRKRRLAAFSQQLPYVADFIRSTLRAGHPLTRGIQMAAENAPEPMATELRLAVEQMRYGASLTDALESMLKRVPEESLAFFVAAVRVQAQVGSSLAEILDRVADAVRARQRLQQQVRALTAQARISGLVVGVLPFLILALFTLLRPEYVGLLFHDPVGNKLLEAAIAMDLVALFIIRRMVQI